MLVGIFESGLDTSHNRSFRFVLLLSFFVRVVLFTFCRRQLLLLLFFLPLLLLLCQSSRTGLAFSFDFFF